MKTLVLRVERQNESALRIARWLEEQPRSSGCSTRACPATPTTRWRARRCAASAGWSASCIEGDLDETSRFIDACRIAQIAPSLGGVETLIEQPALMSFYELTTEQRAAIGIRDNLVRLSVGIEDCGDLIADLAQAFAAGEKDDDEPLRAVRAARVWPTTGGSRGTRSGSWRARPSPASEETGRQLPLGR